MAFYTRTDDAGIVTWSKYDDQPISLAEGEVECAEAEYEKGRSAMWTPQPATSAKSSTASAKAGNADKPA